MMSKKYIAFVILAILIISSISWFVYQNSEKEIKKDLYTIIRIENSQEFWDNIMPELIDYGINPMGSDVGLNETYFTINNTELERRGFEPCIIEQARFDITEHDNYTSIAISLHVYKLKQSQIHLLNENTSKPYLDYFLEFLDIEMGVTPIEIIYYDWK